MPFGPVGSESPEQISYTVEDLDEAIAQWVAGTGIGPWLCLRGLEMNGTYRGADVAFTVDLAMTWRGDMQIELVAPRGAAPSPYHDARGELMLGIHHVAWTTTDLDAQAEAARAAGLVRVLQASAIGVRIEYFEMPGQPGVLIEFLEGPILADIWRIGKQLANGWDGSEPSRDLFAILGA